MAAEDWIDWGDWDEFDENDRADHIVEYDRVIHTTKKGILLGIGNKMFWVPKSVSTLKPKKGYVLLPHYCNPDMLPANDLSKAADDFAEYIEPDWTQHPWMKGDAPF